MPPEHHDVAQSAGHSGLAAMVVVEDGDIGALETTVRGLAENSVLPGLHVCFIAREPTDANALSLLHRIARQLDGRHGWTVKPATRDADFGGLLREVTAAHPNRDIALIAPGADLPFAWDARLAKAACAAPDVAAAIPMCDVSPLYALVDEKFRAGARSDALSIDRSAYSMGDRSYYEIPGIHGVCAYLRRDALDAALPFIPAGGPDPRQTLDAIAKRWRATGRCCVICDYLYVGYAGDPQAAAPAQFDFDETAFVQHHPLGGLRRAVNEAIERGLPPVSTPGLDHRPVQLHIMHFWGGGLERWVRDFGRADPSRINMILATYRIGETGGQRIVLYSDPAALVPVRTWDIARPIRSTATSSIEYRRILAQVLDEFDVEAIVVSSLIGHSLDALTQPRKTLVVCHDFYPVCQAINPQFGTTCTRCTLDDLRRCARSNPLNDLFDDQTSEEWHEMRELFVTRLLENGYRNGGSLPVGRRHIEAARAAACGRADACHPAWHGSGRASASARTARGGSAAAHRRAGAHVGEEGRGAAARGAPKRFVPSPRSRWSAAATSASSLRRNAAGTSSSATNRKRCPGSSAASRRTRACSRPSFRSRSATR